MTPIAADTANAVNKPETFADAARPPRTRATRTATPGPFALLLTALLVGSLATRAQAAALLPQVTCGKSSPDARCKVGTSSAKGPSIGTGLPFALGGFVSIGSGYIDEASNSLLLPVEFGGQEDNQGVVMRVDLATGNRTVVSGYDGEEWHGHGVKYVSDRGYASEAYDLGRVEAVRPGPNGSILALVDKGLSQRTELIRIDPRSGDRTLVWASRVFADAAPSGPTAIRDIEQSRFNHGSAALCRGGDKTALKPSETFETDGVNAYLFMANNPLGTGSGLVRVPLTGGNCTWVSHYYQDGTSEVGSGATINTASPVIFGSALVGKEFLAVSGPNPNGNALFAINTQTGERRTVSLKNVSAPARSKGSGEEVGFMGRLAVGRSTVATGRLSTSASNFESTLVDLQTGERTYREPRSGTLSVGRSSDFTVVAAVPGTDKFVVAFGDALHIWDAQTDDSFVLSR